MPSPPLRIAIVGGGPAGLTLGLLLHQRSIPCTIFELRQKPSDAEFAKPAGSLDLHEESGIAAIRSCGLFDEFVLLTDDCTEAQKVSDRNGNIVYADEGESSTRPEISRHKLLKLLLSHLPESSIRWGRKVVSARRFTVSGRDVVEIDVGENDKQIFDLVIGADGAWSKIRSLLTDVKPQYAGKHCITLNIESITKKHPCLADLVGRGTFASLGNRHGVISQRSAQDSVRLYIFISKGDENFAITGGLTYQNTTQAMETLLADDTLFGLWGSKIKDLISVACENETARNPNAKLDIKPLYMLPVGHSWEHQPGATIIGDAAHLMCPWAGEGVNLAMRDSLLLSQAICQAFDQAGSDPDYLRDTLDSLLREFESGMVARAKVEAEGTIENGERMFGSEDSARDMADWFKGSATGQTNLG